MSTDSTGSKTPIETPRAQAVDMRLEIVVIPVSDLDRAKRFDGGLGWRLDGDFAAGDDFRVIQFTPPGSGCSVIFGKNVTAAAAGSARGLYLIVSDIEAARAELLDRGVEVSEAFHGAGNVYAGVDEPYLFGRLRVQRAGSRASQLSLVRVVQSWSSWRTWSVGDELWRGSKSSSWSVVIAAFLRRIGRAHRGLRGDEGSLAGRTGSPSAARALMAKAGYFASRWKGGPRPAAGK